LYHLIKNKVKCLKSLTLKYIILTSNDYNKQTEMSAKLTTTNKVDLLKPTHTICCR